MDGRRIGYFLADAVAFVLLAGAMAVMLNWFSDCIDWVMEVVR